MANHDDKWVELMIQFVLKVSFVQRIALDPVFDSFWKSGPSSN